MLTPVIAILVKELQQLGSKASENIFKSLAQMQPDSDFLQALPSSNLALDYTIICGDTSLIDKTAWQNLFRKLSAGALTEFIFDQPNDIAVTVASAFSVPTDRKHRVACTHVDYFDHQAALATIVDSLID